MTFSSSMSVVEYYLLKRFPVPYGKRYCHDIKCFNIYLYSLTFCINLYLAALYFFAVATVAALVGQHVVTKVIAIVGRASLIIFVLAATIFVSAISLGMWHCLRFSSLISIRLLQFFNFWMINEHDLLFLLKQAGLA